MNMAGFFIFTLFFLVSFSPAIADEANESGLRTYIVHVEHPEVEFAASEDRENWHGTFLPDTTLDSLEKKERMLYSYTHAISGFAARLSAEEVKSMEEKDGFISAHLDRKLSLQTTHSPRFLGLNQDSGFWKESNFGKGVIIGVLDSGILPSHPSFSDEGMPPPPAKWKGRCEFNVTSCNNKLIGARVFNIGARASQGVTSESPLDKLGHGTHTSSTAAGGFVKDANVLGNAKGTASGMAPHAHLAMYKVCYAGCLDSDLLAAIDAAVNDGVDVLSISIGGDPNPFYRDSIAIGSFRAVQKGIFVSTSAGNSGPSISTVSNEAPWILTVGASTTDRTINATARLGNGEEFDGESLLIQPRHFPSTLWPLVYAGANGRKESALCAKGSLKSIDVKGKVVLCARGGRNIARTDKGVEVKRAGGVAMILMNAEADGFSTMADAHVLPATHVSFSAGLKIKAYINSTSAPMATIVFKGTVIGHVSSPVVASFSSRGPSVSCPGILKPDIIGLGVNILAAWPFPLDNTSHNSKSTTFNLMSGTSMSCPHLSGIAALVKSSHPDWSPAAIKSSMMTTAQLLNHVGKPIADETLRPAEIFATGAGHVDPSGANDPGLVYEIQPDDYIPYLCGLNFTDAQVGILAHRKVSCSKESRIPEGQLNYPSFSVILGPSQTFTRRVTNVGEANSSYTLEIFPPKGVAVSVKPKRLSFTKLKQTMTYTVTFTRDNVSVAAEPKSSFAQGLLKWVSEKYSVRSPISVTFG